MGFDVWTRDAEKHCTQRVQHTQTLSGLKGVRVWEKGEEGTVKLGTLVGADLAEPYRPL